MGGHMSKKSTEISSSSGINFNINPQLTTELNSYAAACRADVDLQSFDTTLQARANNVINTLAVGVEVRALSFDSLKEVTECLLEMNQEVVKVILECKKDIWKNQELFELVEEYFENSLQTLDFCAALEKCLKRARDSQLLILVALQQFEEENGVEGNRYVKTLEELKNFRSAGDPFTEDIDAGSNGKVLTYRVERNGGLVNATTGQKSDILIQNGNGPRSKAAQAVKKMKIEEIDEDDEMDE